MDTLDLGQEAVMVFFVISGYCITAATEACLKRGLSWRTFMWRRIRRIYPPYALSMVYYLATRLAKLAMGGTDERFAGLTALDWIQNVTMMQWLTLLFGDYTSPAHNPTNVLGVYWSLNYEEQFYLLMGLAMVLLAWRRVSLPVVLLVSSVAGWAMMIFAGGWASGLFLDYWLMFLVGSVVFYRLCGGWSRSWNRACDVGLAVIAVLGVAVALALGDGHSAQTRWEMLALCSTVGLAFVALRRWDGRIMAWPGVKWLGRLGLISYSLYLIHQANLFAASLVVDKATPSGTPYVVVVSLEVVVHIALAVVFWWLCERPFLNRKLPPGPNPDRSADKHRPLAVSGLATPAK